MPACDDGGRAGDAGPVDIIADAAPDAVPLDGSCHCSRCNPVAQTGCGPDERCTRIVVSDAPYAARTDCVPEGDVAIGEACTPGEPGERTGFDDCVGGSLCHEGACTEICSQSPDSCDDGATCVPVDGVFDDVEGIGLCTPACDLFQQDCAAGEGCYVRFTTGRTRCEVTASEPGVQGDTCIASADCDAGYDCVLPNPSIAGTVCAYYCDTTDTGGPSCADLGMPALSCVAINDFHDSADAVPDEIGTCVDCCLYPGNPACVDATCP